MGVAHGRRARVFPGCDRGELADAFARHVGALVRGEAIGLKAVHRGQAFEAHLIFTLFGALRVVASGEEVAEHSARVSFVHDYQSIESTDMLVNGSA
jgi:hypothetical protein